MSRYEAILFDVGGTLLYGEPSDATLLARYFQSQGNCVDSTAIEHALQRAQLRQLQVSKRSVEWPDENCHSGKYPAFHAIAALELSELFKFEVLGSTIDNCLESASLLRKWILLEEDLPQLLATIHQMGLSLGIVSNWEAGLQDVLEAVRIRRYFDVIISSTDVGFQKPDPRIFLLACKVLHVSPYKCLYVGDMALDVVGGNAAGMEVALLGTSADGALIGLAIEPTYRISKASDLICLLHGNGKKDEA